MLYATLLKYRMITIRVVFLQWYKNSPKPPKPDPDSPNDLQLHAAAVGLAAVGLQQSGHHLQSAVACGLGVNSSSIGYHLGGSASVDGQYRAAAALCSGISGSGAYGSVVGGTGRVGSGSGSVNVHQMTSSVGYPHHSGGVGVGSGSGNVPGSISGAFGSVATPTGSTMTGHGHHTGSGGAMGLGVSHRDVASYCMSMGRLRMIE